MIEFTDETLKAAVDAGETMVVDFWAPWCGPCRTISPILDQVSSEMPHVKIAKVNVDECGESALQYGIRSIPTIVFFKDGVVVDKHVGIMSKTDIVNKINGIT